MSHTYTKALFHCIFSTKERRRTINRNLQPRLWRYVGGIAEKNKMKALGVGGVEDHIHLLLSIPADISLAKCMQFIKGGSSKWVHETFPDWREFAWQQGYSAFSVSSSQREAVLRYIARQAEHHRRVSFEDELIAFLKKNGIDYDPRFVFG